MKKIILIALLSLSWLGFSQEQEVKLEKDSLANEEPVRYALIERAPVYPGCSGEGNLKSCFNLKMRKHMARNLNVEDMKCKRYEKKVNEETGKEENLCVEELPKGKIKIHSKFRINKQGSIDNIDIDAPSERIKEEMLRVLKKLPKFEPGLQRERPVNVSFEMPLVFVIG